METAPLRVSASCFMSVRKLPISEDRHFQADRVSSGPSPTICIFEIGWHEVCHPPAIKYWFVELLSAQGLRKEKLVLSGTILKKGKFQSKYIVSLA